MSKKRSSDSLLYPLINAGIIHILMFGLLLTSFQIERKEPPLDIQIKAAPIINATAVSSEDVDKLVKQKEKRISDAAKAERDRKKRIRDKKAKAAAKKKKSALDKKRKKAADEKKRKADADKKRKANADKKRKADAEKKRKADADKKRKADAEKKRTADAERKKQIEREMQAQLDAEANAAQEQRVLSELQKYVALIKNKISRNWIMGNQTGNCVLEVKLAMGGFVIDIREVGGLPAICRSAKAAVYKADPLPVSKDPVVFNRMRILRLDLDPQEM
ncbi:MAG: cell envelope integrity protein TolA [Gammaproteobacteria bacterium]|nr:cell envelope integrity protein TolA [Gammaproteobacteria bacterium]